MFAMKPGRVHRLTSDGSFWTPDTHPLDALWLVRRFRFGPGLSAMKSITRDCDEEEARAISQQLGRRTEGTDYLAERQAAEEWLRSRLPLGVQVTCSSPLYYRLTPTHMTNKHADHFWMNVWGTSIPADRMTFTLDDSMRLFAREERRPWLSGITTPVDAAAKLHTAEEIRDWIEQYGFPYPLDDPEQYIEAQVWDEAPTIMYL